MSECVILNVTWNHVRTIILDKEMTFAPEMNASNSYKFLANLGWVKVESGAWI